MRKAVLYLLGIAMIAMLAACGAGVAAAPTPTPEPTPMAAVEDATPTSTDALAAPPNEKDKVAIFLNGQRLGFDVPTQIIEGVPYAPLRPVFEALGCDIYCADLYSMVVVIVKNDIKLVMSSGYNGVSKGTGDLEAFIENAYDAVTFDAYLSYIDDGLFAPISYSCEALGVEVDWNETSATLHLTCDEAFIADKNTDKVFADEYFALYEDNFSSFLAEGGSLLDDENPSNTNYALKFKDTTVDILVKAGVVSAEDLEKDAYITKRDALKILLGYSHTSSVPDETLRSGVSLDMLWESEIENLNLDENMTGYEAVLCAVRMTGSSYGCGGATESYCRGEGLMYKTAYKKGMIDSPDITNAGQPIGTQDFYDLVHRAFFVVFPRGDYGGVSRYRIIDRLM